jgi:predicted CxxxxCH...CXXCH cytochrome family protein
MFDPNGLAVGLGKPLPSFDAITKTCSNIACHGVPAGSFSYYFPDGTGEPALNTLTVFGNSGGSTPSWYSTGGGACGSCHANPPKYGTDGSNVWHSSLHANQGSTGAANQCQFCHPDASGSNGQGTTITNPALHGNGIYNVQARFTSSCFGCH